MIEQRAKVIEVRARQARVEGLVAPACGACETGGGCGIAALAHVFQRRVRRLWVTDDLGVQVGDRVVIGLHEQALQRASLVAYVWPLLGLLTGAVLGDGWRASGGGELITITTGLTGLLAGVMLARRQSERMASAPRYQARVLRVLDTSTVPTATLDSVLKGIPE